MPSLQENVPIGTLLPEISPDRGLSFVAVFHPVASKVALSADSGHVLTDSREVRSGIVAKLIFAQYFAFAFRHGCACWNELFGAWLLSVLVVVASTAAVAAILRRSIEKWILQCYRRRGSGRAACRYGGALQVLVSFV